MNPTEVISILKSRGVSLWQEGGKLKYRAPNGVLTEREKEALKAHKASILKALSTTTVSTSATPVEEKLEPPARDDRLCYQCQYFTRSSYGYPLGLCQRHDDKNEHPNGRIQHNTSRPTQLGCGDFAFRQASDYSKNCLECRHYNALSTMCSQVSTGCLYPTIPPCSGAKFQRKLQVIQSNKEVAK